MRLEASSLRLEGWVILLHSLHASRLRHHAVLLEAAVASLLRLELLELLLLVARWHALLVPSQLRLQWRRTKGRLLSVHRRCRPSARWWWHPKGASSGLLSRRRRPLV